MQQSAGKGDALPLTAGNHLPAIADHVFANYDGVLRVDGDVGRKAAYDPRSWGRKAEAALAARVAEAAQQFGSSGRSVLA